MFSFLRPPPSASHLVHVLAWDVWAGVELDAVHCVTRSIYAIRKRAGGGEVVPVACEICRHGLTLGWRIPVKIHSCPWEGGIICLVLHKTLSDTTDGFHSPPTVRGEEPYVKFGWGRMKRKASTAPFRSFWCLGNAHSIIKAALLVKLFVQFPEQSSQTENL